MYIKYLPEIVSQFLKELPEFEIIISSFEPVAGEKQTDIEVGFDWSRKYITITVPWDKKLPLQLNDYPWPTKKEEEFEFKSRLKKFMDELGDK